MADQETVTLTGAFNEATVKKGDTFNVRPLHYEGGKDVIGVNLVALGLVLDGNTDPKVLTFEALEIGDFDIRIQPRAGKTNKPAETFKVHVRP